MPSYPFKTCIAVPKYPKIFFALRCKLIYDKLNIKIIFSELICITHTQKIIYAEKILSNVNAATSFLQKYSSYH